MPEIRFDTGLVTYNLNGVVEVSFNPTDSNFVEKLFGTFDQLDRQQEEYRQEVNAATDNRKVFEIARKRDTEMRSLIDGVFDTDVCKPLFGSMNVYAMADGLPAWCNLMLAILDIVKESFDREQKAIDPRVEKFVSKYRKKNELQSTHKP